MSYQGKPLLLNLLRHDYEAVAEGIHKYLRARHGPHYCYADADGIVRLRATRDSKCKPLPQADWIGTYTKATAMEDIESDLINRLRELSQRNAA